MTLITVTNQELRPDLTPKPFGRIVVGIVNVGWQGDGTLITDKSHHLSDENGLVSIDLAPSPAGTWYVWNFSDGTTQKPFQVPASGGPYTLQSLLVTAPTAAPDPAVTQAAVLGLLGDAVPGLVDTEVAARLADYPTKANNLSDLASVSTARTNLGLGTSATKNTGTATGTVATGDDSRITGAAQKSANLSDVANAATALTNLGGATDTAVVHLAATETISGAKTFSAGVSSAGTGSGTNNERYGASAMPALTTGAFNTAAGRAAMTANTTGSNNTALGESALTTATAPSQCTAIGRRALRLATGSISNVTAIGYLALGTGALSATDATAVGASALTNLTTGSAATAVGSSAGLSLTTGVNNTALGYQALKACTTGSNNTALGFQTLLSNTADENTAVGVEALFANTTGNPNTAIGYGALTANTTGRSNNAFGFQSVGKNLTGSFNNGFGHEALWNATGNDNSAFGHEALMHLVAGTDCTAVGYAAGVGSGGDDPSYVVALGSNATASHDGSIAIGAGTTALAAGSVAVGRDSAGTPAATSVANEIKLGTALHSVNIPGALKLAAAASAGATLSVPHGAAPTSPVNGDIWTTTAGLFVRVNGATVGPLS